VYAWPGKTHVSKVDPLGNRIVGGGFYSGFAALRVSEAWQFFGEANGVASLGHIVQGKSYDLAGPQAASGTWTPSSKRPSTTAGPAIRVSQV
jgi:hypothetical protein